MNYLLFFISTIFSFIIYNFYKLNNWADYFSSITWNLFIDSILFLILAIFLFFYFSSFNIKKEKKQELLEEYNNEELNYIKENKEKRNILKKINFKNIITSYIYYIWFILFYISIYLILKSFWITDFSYIIFFLNFIIIIFFIISHKAEIFKDFIRINTILFSLYYIFLYLYIFITGINSLILIDFINTLFLFSFFITTFYFNYKEIKIKKEVYLKNTDNSLVLYFFIYSFIVFSLYFKMILIDYFNLTDINYSLIFVYTSIFLNILIYYILQKIVFFRSSRYTLRALSFLFSYISIIFSIIYFIKNIDEILLSDFTSIFNTFSLIFILLYWIIFNFEIHKKFQNYISLFFSVFSFVFLLNFLLYKNIFLLWWNIVNLWLILNFSISYFIVIFTYLYRQNYSFDYFFLHICAYFVNILWISYYLYFWNIDILNIWIILLLDSILIFLSYFKLKKIGRGE